MIEEDGYPSLFIRSSQSEEKLGLETWAYDILTAIHEIDVFLKDVPNFSAYQGDLKTKRAVERNLEIIGELESHDIKRFIIIVYGCPQNYRYQKPDHFMAMIQFQTR